MKTCATCKWFKLGSALAGLKPGAGFCYRFPPNSNAFAGHMGQLNQVTTRPSILGEDEACGEYKTSIEATINGVQLEGFGD